VRLLIAIATLGLTAAFAAPPAKPPDRVEDVSEFDAARAGTNVEAWPGAAVYRSACAGCHEGQVPKAPHKTFLQMLSGPTILASLEHGLMKAQGGALSPEQRRHVAEYLSATPLANAPSVAQAPRCAGEAARFDLAQRPVRSGWGYSNSRFVAAQDAGLTRSDVKRLGLKWALEFPNATRARSQPHIAYGAIFVGSQDGTVYALDLDTGCVRWTFKAGSEVRTAVVPYEHLNPARSRDRGPRVYFGDVLARMYSLDALTGRLMWSVKIDDHPHATLTGTATLHEDTVYVPVSSLEVTTAADPKYECCTFRGAVVALDAWTGEERWRTWTIDEAPRPVKTAPGGTRILAPSGAPVWNSPTLDAARGLLYVGSGENYSSPADDRSDAVFAFQLADGKRAWSRQMTAGDAWNVACMMRDNPNCPVENGPDVDFASGTILVRMQSGKDALIAGQKNGVVYALDPLRRGEVLWQQRVGRGGIQGGVHFGMAAEGTRVYVPISDMANGRDGRPTTEPPRPGMYALDASTGRVVWSAPARDRCGGVEFCDPGISAAVTAIPGVVFAGHMDGMFRAYDGADGQVLFEFDSRKPVKTVAGGTARGGSFGGPGAAVRDGHVVVNSGYGLYFHMPGNVLLTFAPERS
jgi:polyvinyl alcohol dehydrogenase (cytochrome)